MTMRELELVRQMKRYCLRCWPRRILSITVKPETYELFETEVAKANDGTFERQIKPGDRLFFYGIPVLIGDVDEFLNENP
jgi:hypothetical protein